MLQNLKLPSLFQKQFSHLRSVSWANPLQILVNSKALSTSLFFSVRYFGAQTIFTAKSGNDNQSIKTRLKAYTETMSRTLFSNILLI